MRELRLQILDRIISSGYRGKDGNGYRREDLVDKISNELNALPSVKDYIYPTSVRTLQEDLNELEHRADLKSDKRVVIRKETFVESDNGKDSRHIYYEYYDEHKEGIKFSVFSGLSEEQKGILTLATSIITSIAGLEISDELSEIVQELSQKAGLAYDSEISTILKFDNNPNVNGIEYLPQLVNAIQNKEVLKLGYQDFKETNFEFIIHPYFIKYYRSMYHLFAWNEKESAIYNFPFDRITDIRPNRDQSFRPAKFREDKKVTPEEHFKDVVGLSIYDKPIQTIVFKLKNTNRINYLLSKPLHRTQSFDQKTNEFSIKVIPNFELKNELRYLDAEYSSEIDFAPPPKDL